MKHLRTKAGNCNFFMQNRINNRSENTFNVPYTEILPLQLHKPKKTIPETSQFFMQSCQMVCDLKREQQ